MVFAQLAVLVVVAPLLRTLLAARSRLRLQRISLNNALPHQPLGPTTDRAERNCGSRSSRLEGVGGVPPTLALVDMAGTADLVQGVAEAGLGQLVERVVEAETGLSSLRVGE